MSRQKLLPVAALWTVASLLLAACGPQTIIQTVEVPKEVIVTQQVEVPVVQTQVVEVQAGSFTRPHPLLSDLRVRQALAYCTNKLELVKSVYPFLDEASQEKLVMDSFLPSFHWAYAGKENIAVYDFDPAKGAALLEEAGWTLTEGATFRTNAAGDELALKFTTTTAAFRQTWAAVYQQQLEACGVRLIRLHVPAAWLFGDTTGLAHRDYEMAAYAFIGQPDPGGQTTYACDQIPLPENNWLGQNGMGWCNPLASDNIKLANNTLLREERIPAYRAVQQEFTKDVPMIPLFNRTDSYAVAADLEGFEPAPGQQWVTYNAHEWAIPGKDTIVYGFTQEPASMFTLVESGKSAVVANSLVQGLAWTSLNYEFAPSALKQLPTLESGLSTNNDVEVKEGDKVADANGNIAELAAGMTLKTADGETVAYSGGTVTMKQLVSKFEYLDNLTWSDGTPVSKTDFELKFKIDCDRESGSISFITCDQIQNIEFADNGYTITTLPGVQAPLYFLTFDATNLPDIYPAHLVLSDGRKLADVPASEWATLPEIAETPLGIGPYVLKEWVKGEKMVFEANPFYYGGEPKTKNLIVFFITAENAEAQLIGGQVDILDDTTLAGISETLKNAGDAGAVKIIIDPSATWEHIDFNMFLP